MKYKTILLDKNIFCETDDTYLDAKNLMAKIEYKKMKLFLLENELDKKEILVPNYVSNIIKYTKQEIRKDTLNLYYKLLNNLSFRDIKEILLVSSDQELLKALETTGLDTCLIYKNNYDVMETKTTYEFNNPDKVKKLIEY